MEEKTSTVSRSLSKNSFYFLFWHSPKGFEEMNIQVRFASEKNNPSIWQAYQVFILRHHSIWQEYMSYSFIASDHCRLGPWSVSFHDFFLWQVGEKNLISIPCWTVSPIRVNLLIFQRNLVKAFSPFHLSCLFHSKKPKQLTLLSQFL